jgi:ribosomal-protein-alanine N-acetyltransferase
MKRPPEFLETTRLILRPPKSSDANAIFRKYAQDPDVTRFLIFQPHENIETTRRFIRHCLQGWKDNSAFHWVIALKSDDDLIGMIELRILKFQANIGYVIASEYWGKGYTTEAAKTITDWALAQAEIFRVWATCDVDNLASARVLEKAGMQREGVLRRSIIHPNISDEPRDSFLYSKVK